MKKDTSHRTTASGHYEKPPPSQPTTVTNGSCQICHVSMARGSASLLRAPVTITAGRVIGPTPPSARCPSKVKEDLDSMVQQGIIKPVGNDPSEWCHPLIVASKDRSVHITVDLTHLNHQVSWKIHASPMLYAAVHSVTPSAC
ncbi:hypothetical protein SK128_024338 [Halocaridina rubra]|uniref:Uncharacterized protein n=1 Tax=Halocaridina rubra TaxID=373956 RepID=A0AAN8ZW21_HALRR